VTGLLIQPLIGALSDKTWHQRGRKPYFLIGALLCSFALLLFPFSSSLWMAAGFTLDIRCRGTMEYYRAFIADKLDDKQMPLGFQMQSFLLVSGKHWLICHYLFF
jgi:maltose/moltooligosaccharide transporter